MSKPWLEHYDQGVKHSIEYERVPLTAYLDRAASATPEATAVRFRNYLLTYRQLRRRAGAVAAGLKAGGLEPGDRVAIMLPNLPQTVVAYWGALLAGAVVVMANPLYKAPEITHQFTDAGVRFVIALDLLWEELEKVESSTSVETFFLTKVSDGLAFPYNVLFDLKVWRSGKRVRLDPGNSRVRPFSVLFRGKGKCETAKVDPAGPALYQYTGGTTGLPKGCVLSHTNMVANILQCKEMLGMDPEGGHSFLAVLPFFHIYGLTVNLNLPTLLGASILPLPRYVPGDVLAAIHRYKPTVFPGAPAVYLSLMARKDIGRYDLTSLKYLISGSAPMPVEHMRRFEEKTGAVIIEGYGLTEASPVTHLNPLRGERKPGSIGLPFPDTDCRLADLNDPDKNAPPGEPGELLIRGPQVCSGYLNRPDETARTIRDGWLHTGDVAEMDEEGYFFIVDRKKDLILTCGYNVYPREVEEVLLAHPGVAEAVCVGVPNPARGEAVKAYVVLRPGKAPTAAQIIAFARERLAGYKVPRRVEFADELPKTIVGKVLRRKLREREAE